MKKFLTTLILLPSVALACDMDRATSETQFVIDPAVQKIKLESKKDLSLFEVSKCAAEEKFIYINTNTIYYQDDTSRRESISGQLLQTQTNCSIKTEQPMQKIEPSFLDSLVKQKYNFIKLCARLVITNLRGQKITTHPNSTCQLKSLNENSSSVETDGLNCFIAVDQNSRLQIQAFYNKDCLDSSFLNSNQIQAQDIESVVRMWPVGVDQGKLIVASSFGARYIRYTVLPQKDFMPRSMKEDQNQAPFMSALSTNINPGNLFISPMGKNLVTIQPTFLVENISKDFCQDTLCAKTAGYTAPISGLLKLTQINMPNNKKQQVGEWSYSMKIPGNFSGMAEIKPENNLTGLSMGALNVNMVLAPGAEYEMDADFYEPRAMMDELSYTQNFFDLNNVLDPEAAGDDALPTLPKFGQLGSLDKVPRLPNVGLGRAGVLEFSDRFNMNKNWTHKYDRVCNSINKNCVRLNGIDKSFVKIKMFFKIGPNKEVIAQRVVKQSDAFESFDLNVSAFAKKVCE